MKNARTKFAVALLLFIISLGCGILLIRYVADIASGKGSISSTYAAKANGYVLGVILLHIITIGTFISYLRDGDKLPQLQDIDWYFRLVSRLLNFLSILPFLVLVLLLLILNW